MVNNCALIIFNRPNAKKPPKIRCCPPILSFALLFLQFYSMVRLFDHCWTIRDDTAKESACIPKWNPVRQFSCMHAVCASSSFLIAFSCFAAFVSLCFSCKRLVNMQLVLFKGSMNLVDHCRRFCWFLRCLHTNASHCERPNENKKGEYSSILIAFSCVALERVSLLCVISFFFTRMMRTKRKQKLFTAFFFSLNSGRRYLCYAKFPSMI